MAEQESVSGMLRGSGMIGPLAFVERPQSQLVASVVDVIQQAAVSFLRIDRLHEKEIGPKFDAAVGIPRSELQIHDPLIDGVVRINLKKQTAGNRFVSTNLTEPHPTGKRLPLIDLNPSYLGQNGTTRHDKEQCRSDYIQKTKHLAVRLLEGCGIRSEFDSRRTIGKSLYCVELGDAKRPATQTGRFCEISNGHASSLLSPSVTSHVYFGWWTRQRPCWVNKARLWAVSTLRRITR